MLSSVYVWLCEWNKEYYFFPSNKISNTTNKLGKFIAQLQYIQL